MKRPNPKTGLPFERGDVREDGLKFNCYSKKLIRKDGTFYEYWSKNGDLEIRRALGENNLEMMIPIFKALVTL